MLIEQSLYKNEQPTKLDASSGFGAYINSPATAIPLINENILQAA